MAATAIATAVDNRCAGVDRNRVTTMVDHQVDSAVQGITVDRLREAISGLSGDTPLQIGVVDNHHFNTLLGTLPITSAQVLTSPDGVTLIFHVPGVS